MLRTMLVGLDGSAPGAAAIDLGIRWAQKYEAVITGVAVCDEPTIRRLEPMPMGAGEFRHWRDEALVMEARQRISELLDNFSAKCQEAGVQHRQVKQVGVPAEKLEREAQRCDLVLLGQQTYFHYDVQDTPCETLDAMLRKCPRPIVAVPVNYQSGETVVVAYDGSPQAARALQAMAELGLASDDPVVVVSVAHNESVAAERAQLAVEYLAPHGIEAQSVPVASSASVGPLLLDQAQAHRARLIVMGAFGHSPLREFFLGSVTRDVIRESVWPILLYH